MTKRGHGKRGWCVSILVCVLFFAGSTGALAQVIERGLQLKSNENLAVDEFQDYEQRYAIIVGINKYQDLRIPSLSYATDDATSIKQLLIEKFNYKEENIRLFLDENATKENITSAMYALSEVSRNSQLLFYFAGHGQTVELSGGGEMGALLPYDVDRDRLLFTGIRMNEIRDITNVIAAKHQLFLVDACYGGLAAVTSRALDQQTLRYLSNLLRSEAKQIITAGGKGETVIEKAEWGHSAFAKVLLDGLKLELADLDKNGLVTGGELATYLKPQVNRFSDNHQTPVYRKFTADEGEFIFLMDNIDPVNSTSGGQALLSQVSFSSTPPEADIIINGQTKGKTPLTLSLKYGITNIRIRKEGYTDFTRSVEIQNPAFSFFAPLEKAVTRLNVTANVQDAEVFIDGQLVGKTPYIATRGYGLVKLEIRKEGYLPYEEFVLLDKEQSAFNIELGQSAGLTVRSSPSKATVYLNGEYKGITPLDLSGLVREEHTLRLEKENYPPVEEKINLRNKFNEEVEIVFKERAGSIELIGMDGEADITVTGGQGMQKTFNSLPASSENLTFGAYDVTIRKKGFKPIARKVTVNDPVEQINILNDLKPKSKFGSVMLSVLVPGGGQFYMGKGGRGVLFLIAGAASTGYAISSVINLSDKVGEYKNAQEIYRSAASGFDQKFQNVQTAFDAKESAKSKLALSLGIFMGVRGLDLLDNLVFPSPKKKLENARLKFESGGNSVTMRYNF